MSRRPLPSSDVWGAVETPLGWLGLRAGPSGISHVALPQPSEALTAEHLGADNDGLAVRDDAALAHWLDEIHRALQGERCDFHDWTLDLTSRTPFQCRAMRAAQEIPWGQTRSYWWIAVRTGEPRAARAVGQAMASNPVPIVVPCHRVVRRDGALGGFGGGLEMKRRLLEIEGCELALAAC